MPKKILFLHGFGESSLLAGMSTVSLKAALDKEKIEMDVLEGFTKLSASEMGPIVDPVYRESCIAGDFDAMCWYPLVKGIETGGHRSKDYEDFAFRSTTASQDEACQKLVKYIESIGGVDGIVGFSQGGELGYLTAEHLSCSGRLKEPCFAKLRFIGTFGSEDSFNQRGSAPANINGMLSFFVCYGSGDLDAVHDSATAQKALKAAGARFVTVHKVDGLDHGMPKEDSAYSAMLKAFNTSLTEKGASLGDIGNDALVEKPKKKTITPLSYEQLHPQHGTWEEDNSPAAQQAKECPMPKGWGQGALRRERPEGHVPGKDGFGPTRAYMDKMIHIMNRDFPDEGSHDKPPCEDSVRHVVTELSNWALNGDIMADIAAHPGMIDAIHQYVDHPRHRDTLCGVMALFGYDEYNFTLDHVRDKFFIEQEILKKEGKIRDNARIKFKPIGESEY